MSARLDLVDTSVPPDVPMPALLVEAGADATELVRFLDSATGRDQAKSPERFRAWLVCFNLQPLGRMRQPPVV